MKRSAMIRIIVWSIVIVLLTGFMISCIARSLHHASDRIDLKPTVTEAPETVAPGAGSSFEISGRILENVNVRSAPSEDASAIAVLNPGDAVEVKRYEQVNGKKWLFIEEPVQGWVLGKYVDLAAKDAQSAGTPEKPETAAADPEIPASTEYADTPATEEVKAPVQSGKVQAFGSAANPVREMKITWAAGKITIASADVAQILVEESNVSESGYPMLCKQSGDELIVHFCRESLLNRRFGISLGEELSKDLTILVPRNYALDSLEVEAASAAMAVTDMTIGEVDFDGASGICEFKNCAVNKLDVDTASGDILFSGTLNQLDCDAASASVQAVLSNIPSSIDMDSMSGDLDLTLPENAGFTLTMDAMSSDFITDFQYTQQKSNTYRCGDGSCRISMDALSGELYIRKAK